MANKITQEEIIQFNELYRQYGTYAAVAKATGRAASTVKKYINKDFVPQSELVKKIIKLIDVPADIDYEMFTESEDWGKMAIPTQEERDEMKEVWKECSL